MPARIWTDEDLRQAIVLSTRLAEVAERLGTSPKSHSGMHRLKQRAEELDIDMSHFVRPGRNLGWRKHDLNALFRKDRLFTTTIRRYFLELVPYECLICGLSEWLGQPLTLQVDHIDGDDRNNTLENLRLLCPNCHAQTETWGVQKDKRKPKE